MKLLVDECVYRFYDLDFLELAGVLCIQVDDVLAGGIGAAHRNSINDLRRRFLFRKWKGNNGEFCGSVISQDGHSKDIFLTQSMYALRIQKVTVRARAHPEDKATEAEIKSLRECKGALQWLTKESRPDLVVQVKMSQQAMSGLMVRDRRHAHDVVRRAVQHHDLGILILPIPVEATSVGLCKRTLPFRMLVAGSRKLDMWWRQQMIGWQTRRWHHGVCQHGYNMKRVVSCTLAAGTKSLLNGLGHAEWFAAHLAEMKCPNFEVERRSNEVQHVKLQCAVDDKPLHDHLISSSSLLSVEDKRCGFDLVVARQCLARLRATIRWSPTDRQLADAQ